MSLMFSGVDQVFSGVLPRDANPSRISLFSLYATYACIIFAYSLPQCCVLIMSCIIPVLSSFYVVCYNHI